MEEKKQNLILPVAIVVAGVIVAGAIYFTSTAKNQNQNNNNQAAAGQNAGQENLKGPKEISSSDHVLGSPDAPLTMILFTDMECPWCKKFNDTVNQMMSDYGKEGKIRMIMRQFPLSQLHQKSEKEAEASECAADLGGNEKFWQYVNKIFEITPSNDGLDPAQLPKIAVDLGLDKTKFAECLNSGKFSQKVQDDYSDALASGGQGTPYFVIIKKNGDKFPMSGYLPYEQLKITLDQLLAK